MRLSLISLAAALVALVATASPPARPAANCNTSFTKGAKRYVVVSPNVGCRTAVRMAKALLTARVIGRANAGGVQLLRLKPPTPGWTCATSTPVREIGAGCKKGALNVAYIKVG